MTFAKLIILSKHTDQVKRSSLSASKDLESRIINAAKHDLGSVIKKKYNCNSEASTPIPFHKLLNWIKTSGYDLHSTMTYIYMGAEITRNMYLKNRKIE